MVLILFITACSPRINTLKPGEPCPVTPSEPGTFLESPDWSVAGKYPIWLTVPVDSKIPWNLLSPDSLYPYKGRAYKQIFAIADDIQGKIQITGKQVDGNGIVLFPNGDSAVWVNDTTVKYKEKPSDTLIIDTSSQYRITSPKPKGYTFYGSNMMYPHPGCFQFTASIGKNSGDIVVEILDR